MTTVEFEADSLRMLASASRGRRLTAASILDYLSFDDVAQTLTLTQFFQEGSLDLAGTPPATEKRHPVKLVYKVFSAYETDPVQTLPASFIVVVKNPCFDNAYVSIVAPEVNGSVITALATVMHTIQDSPATFDAHDACCEFTVKTVPVSHSLCGELSITAMFDGNAITASDPIA